MFAPQHNTDDPRFLSSVERGLNVLEALSSAPGPRSLTELSRSTGLAVPTLQRLTSALIEAGYLEKDAATKRYRQTVKTIDLLYGYLSRNVFAKASWPRLVRLREVLKMDVSLSVPRGRSMIYVHRLPGHWGSFENTLPGRQLPIHLSASGRCFLASKSDMEIQALLDDTDLVSLTHKSLVDADMILEEIQKAREKGYCMVDQETSPGLATLACPVLNGAQTIAGISVHSPIAVTPPDVLIEQALPTLVSVANAMRVG